MHPIHRKFRFLSSLQYRDHSCVGGELVYQRILNLWILFSPTQRLQESDGL